MRSKAMRWIWLLCLATPLSRPALAGTPAPAAAGTPAPDTAREPAPALDTPAPAPAEARAEFHVALVDLPPAPGHEKAAASIAAAVRAALHQDDRFAMIAPESVARARAMHEGSFVMITPEEDLRGNAALGVKDVEHTYAQACMVGLSLGAGHVILLGGYDKGSHRIVDAAPSPSRAARHEDTSGPVAGARSEAWMEASMLLLRADQCEVEEQVSVRASRASHVSQAVAMAEVEAAFRQAAHDGIQRLFPVRSSVRAVSDSGGEIGHGARHGVREGQYYRVHRDADLIGHVHVDQVSEDSARVTLVRGAPRLQVGDRLAESGTVRVWEVGVATTPSALVRNGADSALGVATAVNVMLYQPVSANMYGLRVERLGLPGFSRWRAAVDYGRQLRILPRRLFAYARVGLGVVRGYQELPEPTWQDGLLQPEQAVMFGLELLPAVGMKLTLGERLVLHASAGYPVALHQSEWNRTSDRKIEVTPEMLVYPHPHRALPTLTLGAGWRF